MERKKARIFAETRVVLRGTRLRRIDLLVIKLNQLEFSPESGPEVQFHLPSAEWRSVCEQETPASLPVTPPTSLSGTRINLLKVASAVQAEVLCHDMLNVHVSWHRHSFR